MNTTLTRRAALLVGAAALVAGDAFAQAAKKAAVNFSAAPERRLTDTQWRARLTPAAYAVLRRGATERPNTSPLNNEHRRGIFRCAGCALPLFESRTKFDSGTGWPSFYRAIDGNLATKLDTSGGMRRTEYHCAKCLGHQGHLFDDGPAPTGLRYCNNGVALTFAAA